MWPALTSRFKVLTLDMIGFGFSAKPQAYDYRIRDQADLYEAYLNHAGVKRYHVLAHDYGDTVAQKLLLSSLGPVVARLLSKDKLAASMRSIFGQDSPPTDALLDAFWRLIEFNDGPKVMHKLIHYITERRRYGELVPHPDVVRLPGIGHYPQVEAPEAVLQGYLAFRERL